MKLDTKTNKGERGPQGPIGPAGAQGAAGPQGAVGPAGIAGDDGLPYDIGNGEPTLVYTQTTAIGDRYLDGVSGNVWERVVFANQFDDTHLVLPGNLTWKKVALLKGPQGPQGPNRLNENTIIDLDQFVKDAGGIRRLLFEDKITRFNGYVHAREDIQTANNDEELKGVMVGYDTATQRAQVLLKGPRAEIKASGIDPDDGLLKEYADVDLGVDTGNGFVRVMLIKDGVKYLAADFSAERKLTAFFGYGLQIPMLSTAQILALPYMPYEGQIVYNDTLHTICFHNGTGWQKVTSTAM